MPIGTLSAGLASLLEELLVVLTASSGPRTTITNNTMTPHALSFSDATGARRRRRNSEHGRSGNQDLL